MAPPTSISPLARMLAQLLELWPRRVLSSALLSNSDPAAALLDGSLYQSLLAAAKPRSRPHHYPLTPVPGGSVLGIFDPGYPEALRNIPDPPLLLYTAGNIALLGQTAVAIVGARRASRPGCAMATRLAQDLAAHQVVIVSGLAHGVDAAAHLGALQATGPTVAVMGSGLRQIYPAANQPLAARIINTGGLLVSEYPHTFPPLAHQFPERNRIVSGLSNGVVVIEAGERSGSLITARLALEQGREVFAVPGPPSSALSRGCHGLIRQGAELVVNAQQICESLNLQQPAVGDSGNASAGADETLSPQMRRLLGHISAYPVSLDELVLQTGLPVAEVSAGLAQLMLIGIVSAGPDGYIASL